MTESKEIKTGGINMMLTGTDGGRQVLLVGLKAAYQDKPQYLKALKREYDNCHDIDHPNIVKYIEEKDVDGYGHCIVMEWEPARTLSEYIQEGHGEEEKKAVIRQIADGLSFLHENRQVHGAINPTTIFVTNQGDRAKILNFRPRFADNLHEPVATMKFRAPEAKDGTVALDARSDIFSLGVIIKDMGMGDDFQSVVAGCCSFGRNDRFADIDAFLEAFEHRRISRRPAGKETGTPASNKKVAILVSVITVLLLVAAALFFNRQTDENATEQPVSEVTDTTSPATAEAPASAAPTPETAPVEQPATEESKPGEYSGELEFMNKLVPQMHIDIDKIYAKGGDAAAIRKRVQAYYKGLRKALGNLNDNQFAAYDKAFAEYITQKNAE